MTGSGDGRNYDDAWRRPWSSLLDEIPARQRDILTRYVATGEGAADVAALPNGIPLAVGIPAAEASGLLKAMNTMEPGSTWRALELIAAAGPVRWATFPSPAADVLAEVSRSIAWQLAPRAATGVRVWLEFGTVRAALASVVPDPDRLLLDLIYGPPPVSYRNGDGEGLPLAPGYAAWAAERTDAIADLIRSEHANDASFALSRLAPLDADQLAGLAPLLAELACSGGKTLRQAALPQLRRSGAAGIAALQQQASSGKPTVRERAYAVLGEQCAPGSELWDWVITRAGADAAPGVAALAERLRTAAAKPTSALPPLRAFEWRVAPDPDFDAAVRSHVQADCVAAAAQHEAAQRRGQPLRWGVPPDFSAAALAEVYREGRPRQLEIPELAHAGASFVWRFMRDAGKRFPLAPLLKLAYAVTPGSPMNGVTRALETESARRESPDLPDIAKAIMRSRTLLRAVALERLRG